MTKWVYIVGSIAVVLAVGFILWRQQDSGKNLSATDPNGSVSLVSQSTLDALPQKSASSADTARIAKGLLPPTNSWMSGMVLQQTPDAVYPMPLSFLAESNGFQIGLPTITASSAEIAGEHTPGITANAPATNFQLTRYDKLSATLTYTNGQLAVGSVTVTEGSPFVFYTAQAPGPLTLTGINPASILEHNAHYLRYTDNGHTYAVDSPQATIAVSSAVAVITMDKGQTVTLYALPGTNDILQQYAGNVLQSVGVTEAQSGGQVRTTFDYKTVNGRPTVFAVLPYETVDGQSIGSFQSIYGRMSMLTGNRFTSTVPAVTPSDKLDLSRLTPGQKQELVSMLPTDVASTVVNQQDSYYAGKQLARAANLLMVAEQLHQTDSADKLKMILTQAFAQRLTPNYFYYDTALRGVAATTPGFGSQDFNDHHFHYGYWLYAGSILAQYDSSFVTTYKNQMNLLAADIASYQSSSQFPEERYYDPYAGHSWAAGLAPFADGNDQESSSEAIHAWNGVSLWGQVTQNTQLTDVGEWMLSNEAHTAAATWRTVDTSDPDLRDYTSPVVGIAFGGKRVYSTWFSPAPAAMLGIQLIPMDPSMVSFASDKNITKVIDATIQNDNYNVPLGDYILMYLSLTNPEKAATLAQQQTNIDDGDSQTYMNAFIFTGR